MPARSKAWATRPIYIGKESDKHWEEGEDLSLLEFKTIEYKRKGNAVATDEQLAQIAERSQARIHAQGHQSAYIREDLQR